MRNIVTAILPPDHRLLVEISPALSASEKVFVLTVHAKQSLVTTEAPTQATVTNTGESIVPVFVFVGSKHLLSVPDFLSTLLGKGNPSWLKP